MLLMLVAKPDNDIDLMDILAIENVMQYIAQESQEP
jgi:hypothetical protein